MANRATVTSATASSDTNDTSKRKPSLNYVSIPIQFQITNVTDWAYKNNAPDALLKDLATQEVIKYLAELI